MFNALSRCALFDNVSMYFYLTHCVSMWLWLTVFSLGVFFWVGLLFFGLCRRATFFFLKITFDLFRKLHVTCNKKHMFFFFKAPLDSAHILEP